MPDIRKKMDLQFFAEGGAAETGAPADMPDSATGAPGTGDQPGEGDGGQNQPEALQMTQEQLDDIINKAYARGARKGKREAEQAAAPIVEDVSQTGAKANEALQRAHSMLVNAALRAAAAEAGFIDPSDAAALVDREMIEIDDDGNVDGADEAVKALLKAKPHLAKRKESGPAGGGVNGGSRKPEKEPLGAQIAKRRRDSARRANEALEPYIRR